MCLFNKLFYNTAWSAVLLLFLQISFAGWALPASARAEDARERLVSAENAIGRRINNYKFIDQDRKEFELKEFFGKPFVVSFIYTSCPHICPAITGNLALAVKGAGSISKDFNVLTIGFDDVNDTPERMKAYGSMFTNDFVHWRFVTADKNTIEGIAREFGFYYRKDGSFFDHMNMVSVVDSKGRIYRHIYGIDFKTEEVLAPLREVINNPDAVPLKKTWLKRWWLSFTSGAKLLCSTYNPITKAYDFDVWRLIGMIISGGTILVIFLFVWWQDIRYFVLKKFCGIHE
ncbi:MAG TPA: hypothetical protein DD641_02855 [Deltaproteobacteria bacterium]|nr:hypothetical protein [Deltaproteobacteria bacterium]